MKRLIFILSAALLIAACSGQGHGNESPVIGISSGFNGSSSTLGNSYVNAVRMAGGVPVILPLVRDEAQAHALMDKIDGLIMSGGEDIAPAYYGEEILNETVGINAVRDTSDFLLIQAARDCAKPIMGICRGHQLINVAFGGTLYQDLPSQLEVIHRQEEPSSVPTHKVGFIKGSRISELVGTDSLMTNTHHHQAIKDIAPGLKVTARAADGVVEGCEGPGVFCVQFHPEGLINGGDYTFLPLFQAFVDDCR
ncbi:MAG: gamma-glutamyl-gamma-aminobutyrate hydrolase family protein [Bacteroidia bacterium]|nr:gamma-glutamyl-gamma-aminobutyrate hydrolase family protein [Bacteroidia bacterium]